MDHAPRRRPAPIKISQQDTPETCPEVRDYDITLHGENEAHGADPVQMSALKSKINK